MKNSWRIKKGHIGIVEKAKETSSDCGMHNRAITVLHAVDVSWNAETHPHGNNLIPISAPPYSPSPQASNQLNTDYPRKVTMIILCVYKCT